VPGIRYDARQRFMAFIYVHSWIISIYSGHELIIPEYSIRIDWKQGTTNLCVEKKEGSCKNDTGGSCKQGGGAMIASEIALVGFIALLLCVVIYCSVAIILMRRKLSMGKRGIDRVSDYHWMDDFSGIKRGVIFKAFWWMKFKDLQCLFFTFPYNNFKSKGHFFKKNSI